MTDLSVDSTHADCRDPVDYFYPIPNNETASAKSACYQGRADFSLDGVSFPVGLFAVHWQCPHKNNNGKDEIEGALIMEADKLCTCQARYHYSECLVCQPCPRNAPGAFRAACPGVFTDCFQTYSVWDGKEEESSNTSGMLHRSVVFVMVMLLWSWILVRTETIVTCGAHKKTDKASLISY